MEAVGDDNYMEVFRERNSEPDDEYYRQKLDMLEECLRKCDQTVRVKKLSDRM
jgi:hypothetical protein